MAIQQDRATTIHRRKGRYMAQVLEAFEELIEPHMPRDAQGDVQDFKGLVRARINALAVDAVDIFTPDVERNGVAQDLRDQLSPVGRP